VESVILSGADQDIQAAYAGLLEYSEPRAGLFLAIVDRALEILIGQPETGRRFRGSSLRSMTLHPFPFRLFYKLHGQRLMVGAVLDTRQEPSALIRQLQTRMLLE
jgi:plasmid stabilization system protein ParE